MPGGAPAAASLPIDMDPGRRRASPQDITPKETVMTEPNWFDDRSATFGDRLAAAREAQGLSQAQLASRTGVRLKTLENWEADRSEPRANRLQMLAGVLNVSIVWMLTGEGEGGVAEPEGEAAADADALSVIAELRDIRNEQRRLLDRMARLEKRLRARVPSLD